MGGVCWAYGCVISVRCGAGRPPCYEHRQGQCCKSGGLPLQVQGDVAWLGSCLLSAAKVGRWFPFPWPMVVSLLCPVVLVVPRAVSTGRAGAAIAVAYAAASAGWCGLWLCIWAPSLPV
jgi:hypothetical protein